MCEKCTRRDLARLIYSTGAKLEQVFTEVDNNPHLTHDAEFLILLDKMHYLLKKFEK